MGFIFDLSHYWSSLGENKIHEPSDESGVDYNEVLSIE